MKKHYFNTTGESAQMEMAFTQKAKKQEHIVMKVFNDQAERKVFFMGASDVFNVFPDDSPITSIRRAINYLVNAGKLVNTEVRKEGLYKNRSELVYCLSFVDTSKNPYFKTT